MSSAWAIGRISVVRRSRREERFGFWAREEVKRKPWIWLSWLEVQLLRRSGITLCMLFGDSLGLV